MPRAPIVRDFVVAFLIVGFACVVLLSVSSSPLMRDLENWTYDLLMFPGREAPPHPEIVFVDIDDATIDGLGHFPVERGEVATLVRNLSASEPNLIALDLLLVDSRPGDEELAAAIADAGNVVVATQFGAGGMPAAAPQTLFCDPEPQAVPYCKPGGALAQGFINLPVDDDGFLRRSFLLPPAGVATLPFPVALASLHREQALQRHDEVSYALGERTIFTDESGLNTFRIGGWRNAPAARISALLLLRQPRSDSRLKGKVVLVGHSSVAAKDLHFTPIFRFAQPDGTRRMHSGTEAHAAALAALLDGRSVRVMSGIATGAVMFLVCGVLAFSILRGGPAFSVLAAGVAAAALFAAAQALLSWQQVWMPFARAELAVFLVLPAGLGYRFVVERLLKSRAEAERRQLMSIFGRYVSPDVAAEIWERREEIVLAGQERMVTVLFSDIRSFTALSAGKPSAEVLTWLNEYLEAMGEIISAHNGFLNKFIGDGLMVLYGVPLSESPAADARRAVASAVAMHARVAELNRAHAGDPTWPRLAIGVGIHTGMVTAGNIGSRDRLEYSVIGETVNLASRLESLTKDFKSPTVLSPTTAELVRDGFRLRELGEASVRGFEGKVSLYGVDAAEARSAEA